jgi:sigma-B regulation protein RsbU (phosphoserine phosphatase)
LLETVRPHDFVTAFIGVLNPRTGEVTYTCAGHNPAILFRPSGRYELLNAGGAVLGVLKDNKLDEGRFTLGDSLLFIYSDGVIDASDSEDEPFGTERVIKFLRKHRALSSSKICTLLRQHLKEFMSQTPQIDDMTFLVVKK